MDMTLIAIVAAVIVALLVLILVLRRRPAEPGRPGEGHGVTDSAAAAIEDVIDQFAGIETHPDTAGPPDDLTRLKGLGPKAAAQLNAFGITRYEQLAALGAAEIAAVDAHMGVFRGRIAKDRWVEQAGYLAKGDTSGFEATFGKLGE